MTAPANNDRPSETQPPEGYETWLDYACATMDTRSAYLESCWKDGPPVPREEMRKAVDTELSALRAKAAAYDEAMGSYKSLIDSMKLLSPDCFRGKHDPLRCELCLFISREISSGRFKP